MENDPEETPICAKQTKLKKSVTDKKNVFMIMDFKKLIGQNYFESFLIFQ
jgi:hypothetical protein